MFWCEWNASNYDSAITLVALCIVELWENGSPALPFATFDFRLAQAFFKKLLMGSTPMGSARKLVFFFNGVFLPTPSVSTPLVDP